MLVGSERVEGSKGGLGCTARDLAKSSKTSVGRALNSDLSSRRVEGGWDAVRVVEWPLRSFGLCREPVFLAVSMTRRLDVWAWASDHLYSNPGPASNLSLLVCKMNIILAPASLGYNKN